jgi:tetratricopeptide (TPR) repeat protein
MDVQNRNLMNEAFRQGQYQRVLDIADGWLNTHDGCDWDALYMKATLLSTPLPEFSDYHRAVGIVLEALNSDMHDVTRWTGFAQVCDNCGVYAFAEMAYRRALEIAPDDYNALMGLSTMSLGIGTTVTLDEEHVILTKAMSLYPNVAYVYYRMAALYQRRQEKAKALDMLYRAQSRLSDDDRAYGEMCSQIEADIRRLTSELQRRQEGDQEIETR